MALRYPTLTADQNAKLSATLRDLKALHLCGIAIIRGKANPIELDAMAKMCNPSKTKTLDKDDRGFLAFQKSLDRAQTFLRMATDSITDKMSDISATVPRDALIDARGSDIEGVKASLSTDYGIVQAAKTTWLALKSKYTDEQLASAGTKTLDNKPRKPRGPAAKAQSIYTQLLALFKAEPSRLGEELLKYDADPANYKLPGTEVQEVVTIQAAQVARAN